MKALVKKYQILKKFSDRIDQETDDLVAVEEPLEIRIQHYSNDTWKENPLLVTMRTPGNDFELVIGFLFSEGIISEYNDVLKIEYCLENEDNNVVKVQLKQDLIFDITERRNFIINSSCGVCGKNSIDQISCDSTPFDELGLLIKESTIFSLSEKINELQIAFKYTGGIHASAIFDIDGNLELIREDVGRHNALDKAIGHHLMSKQSLSNKILLVSGRLSFELVQKAIKARIPIVVAIGAPSSLAVDLAKEFNQTLCGFSSNNRFNIYSGEHRIVGREVLDGN